MAEEDSPGGLFGDIEALRRASAEREAEPEAIEPEPPLDFRESQLVKLRERRDTDPEKLIMEDYPGQATWVFVELDEGGRERGILDTFPALTDQALSELLSDQWKEPQGLGLDHDFGAEERGWWHIYQGRYFLIREPGGHDLREAMGEIAPLNKEQTEAFVQSMLPPPRLEVERLLDQGGYSFQPIEKTITLSISVLLQETPDEDKPAVIERVSKALEEARQKGTLSRSEAELCFAPLGISPPFVNERVHIPESVRHEVWRRDEGRCVQCGSQARLEFDHIIPVSENGSNTARNLQLLCENCNRAKGARI